MTTLKAPIVVVRGGNKLSRLRTLILAYKFIYDRITTLSVIFCISIKFSFVKLLCLLNYLLLDLFLRVAVEYDDC